MSYSLLDAGDACWRPSKLFGVLNTDLAKQLGASTLGARLWRLEPGQANTWHRHRVTVELYVVIEGTGRMRVEDEVLTLPPLSAVLVDAETLRQPFNDTGKPQLWLVVGAPQDPVKALEMSEEDLAFMYPDGPRAMPPELGG